MSHDVYCISYGYYSWKRDAKNVFSAGRNFAFEEDSENDENTIEERDADGSRGFIHDKRDSSSDLDSLITESPKSIESPTPGGGNLYSHESTSSSYNRASKCTSYGSFNTDNSDTFMQNDTITFNITYADGSYASGNYGRDTIKIDKFSVPDVSFAVVNESSSDIGVLGIGLPGLEVTNMDVQDSPYMYENLPMKMKSEGIINKAVYSLYLDQSDAKTGSILFGAVDHAKYEGTLETLPLVNPYSSYDYPVKFDVTVGKLAVTKKGDTVDVLTSNETAVLDSGSTLSYLRHSQKKKIADTLDAKYSYSADAYKLDCDYLDSDATLDITFGSKTIKVPISELIMQSSSGKECYLGIFDMPSQASYVILGDNVLRSAYIVYDVEDYEVHIGQVYYTDDEDIEIVQDNVPTDGGQNSTKVWTGSGRAGSGTSLDDYGNGGVRECTLTRSNLLLWLLVPLCWLL
ncbi:hypothetical protein CORT_0B03850 [Candida orthopsilosis Co 90-125]|uniref:candidapepsin n=1 Tax=Candida orthopsilosis (strain 90-125) TaxID=1136231 RepID=H8X153_CANO9|nr:hypothetical protein CORT_0B03850 [Candida orthopsilosis Co 90-125]CCG22093.1 hypothetical protein CORT_0B03850 [Candida orthopsilosis Co 90-125]